MPPVPAPAPAPADPRDVKVDVGVLGLEWVTNKPGKHGSLKYALYVAARSRHDVVLACDIVGAAKKYSSATLSTLPAELPDFNGYEVLPENVARHFYLDLDFPTTSHPNFGDVIDGVHRVVAAALAQTFPGLTYDRGACEIAEASGVPTAGSFAGAQKSSYHVKFPHPVVFENHRGAREFATLVHMMSLTPEYVGALTFWEGAHRRAIIDRAPYMNNQAFRMLGQSKKGDEGRPLRPVTSANWRDHLVQYRGPTSGLLTATNVIAANDARTLADGEFGNSRSKNDVVGFVRAGMAGEPAWDVGDDTAFYLSCISNAADDPQPRIVFHGICCALINVGAPFALFDAWCAKRGPSKTNGTYRRHTWDSTSVNPRGYGLPFLKRVAEKCVPGCVHARMNKALQDITRVDVAEGGMTREVYNEQWCKPYDLDAYDVVVEKSAMGTGKTQQVDEYILRCRPRRMIAFSPRQIFAESLAARLGAHDFECYTSHAGNSVDQMTAFRKLDRLVIQMESLHKLADYDEGGLPDVEPFDLVIGDEIESCLKQFSSDTTMTRLKRCAAAFAQILRRAKKVMFLDAFISQRTIATLKAILGPDDVRPIIYRENTHVPAECRRVAYDCAGIAPRRKGERLSEADRAKSDITHVLMQKLGEGKRVVFVNSSKDFAQVLVSEAKCRFPTLRVRIYAGEGDDAMDKDVRDVNTAWANVDLLIYTSRITVGVNYDSKDFPFDALFVYGSSWSCNVRDVFQSTMRVRTIREKAMYYSLFTKPRVGPCTREAVVSHIASVKAANLEFRVLWEDAPAWLEELHVMNVREDNVHANHYGDVFKQYLDVTGYERRMLEGVSSDTLPDVEITGEWTFVYEDLPDIDFGEASELRNKICAKEASAREKAMYKRYRFQTKLAGDEINVQALLVAARFNNDALEIERLKATLEELTNEHSEMWGAYCGESTHVVDNLFLEFNETGESLAQKLGFNNPYAALMRDEPAKLAAVQRICKSLGIAHTHDGVKKAVPGAAVVPGAVVVPHDVAKVIRADVIVAAWKERAADVELLRKIMGLRDQSEKGGKIEQGECAKARDAFTAILMAWTGGELIPSGGRHRKRIGGKVVSVQDYVVAIDPDHINFAKLIRHREVPDVAPVDALGDALRELLISAPEDA